MNPIKKPLRRVDVQVSILTAVMVLIATLSVFSLCFTITYKDMIMGLTDRVVSIYDYLEENLDKNTFYEINTQDDMQMPSYQSNKVMLEEIRNTTGVLYLYTAKKDANGELIYVIDGLGYDDDFRYPGDAIEPEIQDALYRALDGEVIMPDEITDTDWGKIFITYLPIHDGNEIIGVVGIEFEADHQYNTYRMLTIIIPLISVLLCLGAVIIAVIIFRRISNPFFQDMYNTDSTTRLKSRNAFEVDIENQRGKKKCAGTAIIVMDLNSLKQVNDSLGHAAGDRYIQIMSETLRCRKYDSMVLYRTGGDEFVVLIAKALGMEAQITAFIRQVQTDVVAHSTDFGAQLGVAAGYAIYDECLDEDLWSVYKRADNFMYHDKRQSKPSL